MMSGLGTMGNVAHRLMLDYANHGMRSTGYTVKQALEKIVGRRESIASATDFVPSYIWWYLGINDEDGDIAPVVDLGKLPRVWLSGDKRNNHRYVYPKEIMDDDGSWKVCMGEKAPHSWPYGDDYDPNGVLAVMLRNGLNLGQHVLSRCVGSWHHGYDGGDLEWEVEMIYAEASPVIDIPYRFPTIAPKSDFRGWRIA